MNPPNILTLSRFGMAGLLIIFLNASVPGSGVLSLIVFVSAAITDALDGHLARNVYGCTDFGKLMDPLADKVLTAAAFIGFVGLGVMPAWMVTLILSREFMVTGLRLLAADKGLVLAAGIWGKHKTIWQMIFISIVLLLGCFQGLEKFHTLLWWFGLFVTALSVWSGWHYFDQNKNLLKGNR
ncbi:CDP-diacylglycerol--glycerol-3-phosphate 3-phosphatidyltransferase [Tichowtungia aerotolerans]|uniref:CDP-diacylglycerol--glycerol-3-phosphate 3-phosphatidyltransferase n=1 Tax=Tichowtungia aerotolerans TaxID=2697043 RepID=A0A6P1M5Q1_9BACT|nr:CDP-diacylglycerol--glycerol-3-phosphate 3-phosphatidyltransferase [Tichowtungia aerotolerans]QHI69187.1 CDP-diacylglycerol--glycerol-3-phosphate 3-phosphatidyltransferase [Tichowtungia aerotolerans]